MSFSSVFTAGSLLLGCALASPVAQGPNTVYQNNPTLRTLSSNTTVTVIPLNFDVVSSLVAPKKLVSITNDTARFPHGWPVGTHPIFVSGTFQTGIEMAGLAIPNSLTGANIRIPCVDQLGDGKTCFNYAVVDYIGGANGQLLSGLVPALAGTVGDGTTVLPGTFDPNDEALKDIGGGESTFSAALDVLSNPVSGPGVAPPAISFTIHRADPTFISESGFHYFISQPLILNNGLCGREAFYFNESFARPFFAESTVQLDKYLLGINGIPDAIAGTYTNGTTYSGNAENIGYNPESCQDAAANTDPKSLQ